MRKLYAKYLNIEVTRRCNMACAQCLRGDARNEDVKLEYITTFLENFQSIHYLGITGGEPSLNPKAMAHILEVCKKNNIQVSRFDVVTNGTQTSMSDEFISVCQGLWDYQENKDTAEFDHMLELSDDEYHDKTLHPQVIDKLSQYPFFGMRGCSSYIYLFKEGRCKEGGKINYQPLYLTTSDYVYGDIYMNVKGQIVSDCNMSYETQEKQKVCHCRNFRSYINKKLRT